MMQLLVDAIVFAIGELVASVIQRIFAETDG
jgi:hypothetical protein